MLTNITVGGQTVGIVTFPNVPLRSVEWSFKDAVATNISPFTGQTQTYIWPGADTWCPFNHPGVMTYPPLVQSQADSVLAALMECRGMANPFLLGDPIKTFPAGTVDSKSKPVLDNSVAGTNIAGQTILRTKGWKPSQHRLLVPGDNLQLGYRLHKVIDPVTSDASGNAVINIWPSLREANPNVAGVALPIILNHPRGLFRLATNDRTWSVSVSRHTSVSYQVSEWR